MKNVTRLKKWAVSAGDLLKQASDIAAGDSTETQFPGDFIWLLDELDQLKKTMGFEHMEGID